MGFFLGFLAGIGAGTVFGQTGLSYPLTYTPKPDGFGKVEVNLEAFNFLYSQWVTVTSYFDRHKGHISVDVSYDKTEQKTQDKNNSSAS